MAGLMKKLLAGVMLTSAVNAQAKDAPAPESSEPKQDNTELLAEAPVHEDAGETICFEDARAAYETEQDGKKKSNGFTLERVRFDTNGKNGGIVVGNGETRTTVSRVRNGTKTVDVSGRNGSNTSVRVGRNGKVDVKTNVNSGSREGTHVDNVKIDTENGSGRVVISNGGKSETTVRASKSSQSVEIGKNGHGIKIERRSDGKINISGNLIGRKLGRGR